VAVACKQCYKCAKHVGALNIWANTGLFVIKLLGGIFGQSQALIADAVHSAGDVIVAVLVMVTLKVSATPPDEDHRWGHGNIEFIVSLIIGVMLICAAVTITVVSLASIAEGLVYETGIMAVWAATISVVANEIISRHSFCVGKQMDSPVLIANARENAADVYSSAAALVGVFGAKMGLTVLDPVAAIIVGFMIARSGLMTLISGVKGITDCSFDKTTLAMVKKIVLKGKGVKGIGRLRARQIGQKTWIDLEVIFAHEMKVSDVKIIVADMRKNIMDRSERIADVVIISRASEPELKETT